jgi:hypothetical protein
MIKNLLTITLLATSILATAQSFTAQYDFASTTSSIATTTDPTTPPTATGVAFGSFSAVNVGTVSTSNGSFTYDSWGTGATNNDNVQTNFTGAIDLTKYYSVTISPQSGYEVTLTDMAFSSRRSTTGPRQYSVRSSMDSYSVNLPATPSTNSVVTVINSNEFFISLDGNSGTFSGNTITFPQPNYTALTTPVTIRFYAWNSEASTGSFRIDDVIFSGSATAVTSVGKVSFDLNSNLNIYPVPSFDGVVFIESKNNQDVTKIEVLDILGNVVSSNVTKGDSKTKLNLANIPNGNYFVRTFSGNSVSTKKIVILK